MSFSCSACCEARLMPSQRSLSLLLHTGGGTNWCTLEATGVRWARLDARSSLRTSGTFRTSASSSPSEEVSQADFWELKKSLSQRRMMFGDGDLASCSSIVGALGLETGWRGKVISEVIKNPLLHLVSRGSDVQSSELTCTHILLARPRWLVIVHRQTHHGVCQILFFLHTNQVAIPASVTVSITDII